MGSTLETEFNETEHDDFWIRRQLKNPSKAKDALAVIILSRQHIAATLMIILICNWKQTQVLILKQALQANQRYCFSNTASNTNS
jgi:hypothetical protein